MVSAFRNGKKNSLTVVGLKQAGPERVQLQVPEGGHDLLWSLYQTTRELNCVKTDMLSEKNGVVEFALPDEAIFTLVGEPARERHP